MFSNLSGKLKVVAYLVLVGGIVGCICIGYMLISDKKTVDGILTIVIGGIGSWIAALPIYALGELIEQAEEIQEILPALKFSKEKEQKANTASTEESKVQKPPFICGKCGKHGPYDGNCPDCGSSIKEFIIN